MDGISFYRRILRFYPRAFRDRFGSEMVEVFAQASAAARQSGRSALMVFWLRELSGLLFSITHERWLMQERPARRFLLDWRRMLPLLLGISLIIAALFSLNYWGYLTPPPSTFTALRTVERIALVKFDADYRASAVPLDRLPALTTPDFPPSQILPLMEAQRDTTEFVTALDETQVGQLAAALSGEAIELGYSRIEYPSEPVFNPAGCGENCFWLGVQPQSDGTILEIWPQFDTKSEFAGETIANHLTPDDWRYYSYLLPAGYLVEGRAQDGEPLVFVNISSGAVSNDHYRYYEYVFIQDGDNLTVRDRLSYAFDISGIEGFTVPVVTLFLFLPLVFLWALAIILAYAILYVARQTQRILRHTI